MSEVVKIYGLDFALINRFDSVDVQYVNRFRNTGSGAGPTPPEPVGEWVQHFEGTDGFACFANCAWDGDSFNWSGPGLVIKTPFDATWQTNYRPLLCKVTYGDGKNDDSRLKDVYGSTLGQFYAATGAGSATFVMDFSDYKSDIVRFDLYGADIITNIEFYEPLWVEKSDNTFWESSDFTWDGDMWGLNETGDAIISVKTGSAWHVGYRPNYFYVNGGYFNDVELRDVDNNVIASKPATTGGPWQVEIDWSNNKNIKDIRITGGMGGDYIYDMSFCFV